MAAAGVLLMQASASASAALLVAARQIFGDGPSQRLCAVAEVRDDLAFRCHGQRGGRRAEADAQLEGAAQRCTAKGPLRDHARSRPTSAPGSSPYQRRWCRLVGDRREAAARRRSRRCSSTTCCSPSNSTPASCSRRRRPLPAAATGLLIQQHAARGESIGGRYGAAQAYYAARGSHRHRRRGLQPHRAPRRDAGRRTSCATLDTDTAAAAPVLGGTAAPASEPPDTGERAPRFRPARCSREARRPHARTAGAPQVSGIVAEAGDPGSKVGCEFCGLKYHFDAPSTSGAMFAPTDAPRRARRR